MSGVFLCGFSQPSRRLYSAATAQTTTPERMDQTTRPVRNPAEVSVQRMIPMSTCIIDPLMDIIPPGAEAPSRPQMDHRTAETIAVASHLLMAMSSSTLSHERHHV